MQDTPEIPQFESSTDLQVKETGEQKEKNEQQSREESGSDREERLQELNEQREKQGREDEERIGEIREDLAQNVTVREEPNEVTHQDEYRMAREEHKHVLERKGIVLSNRFTDQQIEEMGREVIDNLDNALPGYDLSSKLTSAGQYTFMLEQTSFNEYIFRRLGIRGWIGNILKRVPFQAAGFSVGDINYVNGGLPEFLIKRTMYHEYLHSAAANGDPDRNFRGLLGGAMDEGATEYYARQAASKEGFIQNVMNPFYLPNAVTFGLVSRSVGSDVAGGAYFNGNADQLKEAMVSKWGSDSWERVYDYSYSWFGLKGLAYAAFKSLTSR